MSPEKKLFIVVVCSIALLVVILVARKLPKPTKRDTYKNKWRKLQKRCANKDEWRIAIIEADQLLDSAMKNKRIKGATMGERMVEAQRLFSDNDAVWFAHKLSVKLSANPELNPSKQDVKRALIGLGQGLKDIGALK